MDAAPRPLSQALAEALGRRGRDVAAQHPVEALAAAYAAEIDAAEDRAKALEVLGPKLLAALTSLGMAAAQVPGITAGARLTTAEDGSPGAGDVLARMRAQRRGSA